MEITEYNRKPANTLGYQKLARVYCYLNSQWTVGGRNYVESFGDSLALLESLTDDMLPGLSAEIVTYIWQEARERSLLHSLKR